MTKDFLASSDSARSARPLKHARHLTFDEPLDLELGGALEAITVCYETWGRLDRDASNAVLVCHALSGDSHVARHGESDDPGWWDLLIGPGKPIDTGRYFVICPNVLGGCRGTTGPGSPNPATGSPYGRDFPAITVGDMVEVQRRLVEHLGVRRLLAVIGGSMGGMMALWWAHRFPGWIRGCIPVATSARLTSQALAFDVVARNAILSDPNFRDGQYYGSAHGPDTGLAIARMIGHITYLSRESMQVKFETDRHMPRDVPTAFEKRFSVGSYLGYQGDRFVERFDANSYVSLSMAMDLFDLGAGRKQLVESLGPADCRWLILSYTSDWLFPPEESRRMVEALVSCGRRVTHCNVQSSYGHDSFLLEYGLETYGSLVGSFLADVDGKTPHPGPIPAIDAAGPMDDPVSIFQPDRLDYERIIKLIPGGSSVLDLGCGHGELLFRLKRMGFSRLTGVELDERAIVACARLGLDVLQVDLNQSLSPFPDGSYDTVVLSRTLQTIIDVEGLLAEIVRVGRRGIVSFPNFAYYKLRRMLSEDGRAPESPGVLSHKWYDTPNRRFFSIADFEALCGERGIRIHERIALDTEAGREVGSDPNRDADLAICVISR